MDAWLYHIGIYDITTICTHIFFKSQLASKFYGYMALSSYTAVLKQAGWLRFDPVELPGHEKVSQVSQKETIELWKHIPEAASTRFSRSVRSYIENSWPMSFGPFLT